jgi:hypothetical protein
MLYNWMNRASMFISKANRPFKAIKEMHFATIYALIDVYSKTRSSVVDLYASTCMCLSSKNSSQSLHQKNCLTIFHLVGNTIKACQSLWCHILALKSNMEAFIEVMELLVEVATPKPNVEHVQSFNIDSHIKKCLKRLHDCE